MSRWPTKRHPPPPPGDWAPTFTPTPTPKPLPTPPKSVSDTRLHTSSSSRSPAAPNGRSHDLLDRDDDNHLSTPFASSAPYYSTYNVLDDLPTVSSLAAAANISPLPPWDEYEIGPTDIQRMRDNMNWFRDKVASFNQERQRQQQSQHPSSSSRTSIREQHDAEPDLEEAQQLEEQRWCLESFAYWQRKYFSALLPEEPSSKSRSNHNSKGKGKGREGR